MKRILIVFFSFFLLLAIGGVYFYLNLKPISSEKAVVTVVIPKGLSALQVGTKLQKANLIKSPLVFKIYVQLVGKQTKLFAGEFNLSPNLSIPKIVERLTHGPEEVWVTVPEGLRREEIMEKFVAGLEIKEMEKELFRKEFLTASSGKEGYLFPDTYLFPKNASASAVVKMMLNTFDKRVDDKVKNDIASSDYDLSQVVTMASLVERESRGNAERPVVAGILYSRIKLGMPLQVDASVQYVLANLRCKATTIGCQWWPTILLGDRQFSSPFNTYKVKGLPPAPICNPGLSSIKAAVYPEDSNYLYYLHDTKGVIHYAKTLEEHNLNVGKYIGK
jgi:UPF0755 protein